jgi:hypothetical protein
VDQIKEPLKVKRAGATIAAIAIICGAIAMMPGARAWSAPTLSAVAHQADKSHNCQLLLAAEPAPAASPSAADDEDTDVPTSQVDKYINVYEAMQKDHNLTVEQAASKQGLTLAQFRELEGKIERDDTLRERVRKALRHAANPKASDSSDE